MAEMQAESEVSPAIAAKDLRGRGGNFVGPTIVYAFMQATGMVNDHLVDCCRHEACRALARELKPWRGRYRRAWQRMLSGRRLDLIEPSPLDVEIGDIAHGLARVARWNGQTRGRRSSPSPSIRCWWRRCSRRASPRLSANARLWRCCMTRPEYVIGDMISPFKAAIGGDYKLIEERLQRAVHIRFGLIAEPPDDLARCDQDRRPDVGLSRGDWARRLLDRGSAQALRRARPAAPRFRRLPRADAPRCGRSPLPRPVHRTRRGGRPRSIEAPIPGKRRMPRLHVCSLALIGETVAKTGARSLVTLLSPGTEIERPTGIRPERHLYLAVSDIVEPLPVRSWRTRPTSKTCSASSMPGTGPSRW